MCFRIQWRLTNVGLRLRPSKVPLTHHTPPFPPRVKVDQPQEVVKGNPTVIKMLVSFYRHARGQNALRDILGPAIREVLQERALSIRTDPVEIYKSWINQTESQTGHKRSVNRTCRRMHMIGHCVALCCVAFI